MKFVKERVNVICQELARLSISQKIKITDMQVKMDAISHRQRPMHQKSRGHRLIRSMTAGTDRTNITGSAPPSPFRRASMEKSLDESPCRTGRMG